MKAQGLVEYVLILILLAVVIFVMLAMLGPAFGNMANAPCWNETSQACIDHRVNECLKTERYTMDQCVNLIGGSGG